MIAQEVVQLLVNYQLIPFPIIPPKIYLEQTCYKAEQTCYKPEQTCHKRFHAMDSNSFFSQFVFIWFICKYPLICNNKSILSSRQKSFETLLYCLPFSTSKKQRPKADLGKCYECSVSIEIALDFKVCFSLAT